VIRGNEEKYVAECLRTGWVSSVGSYVTRFEAQLAEYVGAAHGVAMSSGTAALHVALLAAGVRPGDEVLMSDLTFIAPANAVRYAGAWPVFVDAEPNFWQIDPAKLEGWVSERCVVEEGSLRNRTTGRRIGALLPVDILGHPVDLDPILALARRWGIPVVEDASESLGASYRGRMLGSQADITCFSFNGNKIITTGGGGMLVTQSTGIAERARYLSTQAKDDPVEYVHGSIGFNYRLTNLQAAMGCAQLEQLEAYVTCKRKIAARYTAALAGIPGVTPMPEAAWVRSSFWLYTVLVDPNEFGLTSRELLRALERVGIQTRPLWQPMHLSRPHIDCESTDCRTAEHLNQVALSLPCSVDLTEADQDRVIGAIRGEAVAAATKETA
jgi:perosamine synthetase